MRNQRLLLPRCVRLTTAVVAAGVALMVSAGPAGAATDPVPYPAPVGGGPVTDYSTLHLSPGGGACAGATLGTDDRPVGSQLPAAFDCKTSTKLTDYAAQPGDIDYDPTVANNPQELLGRKGPGTNRAWESTTGRPDTVIAELDSGIEWDTPELADKVELNMGELPPPCSAAPCNNTRGASPSLYDADHDGIFSVRDYAGDPRVAAAVPASKTRGYLTPEDLIRTFSDGIDHDGNGYPNDIAGWDFYQHDNDPADDVTYGHGTGEAKDSSAQVSNTLKTMSQCPNCRVLVLRVGDSFIADVNHFAAATIYATDNGASIVQEALGTINHTAFAQTALDYAYHHGVLVVASEADEEAGHHNYPAALNHTMVVNSTTHYATDAQQQIATGLPGVSAQNPKSYLELNGCTNWGGYTWVTVESNSCSSDATGQSAGIAGLLYSAARNAVQHGKLSPAADGSGRPLSAEEAKQLFRLAADDVDFSDPKLPFGPPNNFATTLPDTLRYATTGGWDMFTGWGRLNAQKAVSLVDANDKIPAEADVTSPAWWSPLGTSGTVPIEGHVAAPRAAKYTYQVEVAPGVQPPLYPATETWTTTATGSGSSPKDGALGDIDLARVRALIDAAVPAFTPANDPTSTDLPEKDAFRVRVVVHPLNTDGSVAGPDGIEQRQYFDYADTTRLAGWPKNLNADVTAATFADLDGDGVKEMIVGDGNGYLHAFKADGSEAPGFPVHTDPLDYLPTTGTNAFTTGTVSPNVHGGILLGAPAVGDLDHTGYPDISVTDMEGKLYVFDHTGHVKSGFPVTDNPAYSHNTGCQVPGAAPACDQYVAHPVRDHINTVDRAFLAAPAIGDLDPSAHNGLELVVGSEDGHLYAWHDDGTPVAGFPALLRDPAKVASVDPVSHRVTFTKDAAAHYGRQIITTPTIATVGGQPRIFVNTDEEYAETPNLSLRTATAQVIADAGILQVGNTRVYSVYPDGTAHPGTAKVAHLGDNAYVPGWPHKIADLDLELLPDVGSGSDAPPVVATVGGKQVVATASIAGAVDLLNATDGSPVLGTDPQGHDITTAVDPEESKGTAQDLPTIASLGGAVFGRLGGSSSTPSVAMGATGLKRLLDVALPDMQLDAQDELDVFDATTGTLQPGFPALMNDLQFFVTPAIADVDGSGLDSVLQSSAVYDTRAYKLGGLVPTGWPKANSGWVSQTAGVGDITDNGTGGGTVQVAVPTREGNLFVWTTKGSACQIKEWPKYQHDEHNSGDYDTDATPPAVLRDVSLTGTSLKVTASGDDDYCPATGAHYVVTVGGVQHTLSTAPATAGTVQTLDLSGLVPPDSTATVTISEEDATGNLSYPARVSGPSGPGTTGPGTTGPGTTGPGTTGPGTTGPGTTGPGTTAPGRGGTSTGGTPSGESQASAAPDGHLAFTGGSPLVPLTALGLVVAGVLVGRRRRRSRP